MGNNDQRLIKYSVGSGKNFASARNVTRSWGDLAKAFSKPFKTPETVASYNKLSNDEQVALKSINGWFFRTQIDGKKRNAKSGQPSDLVTLDFDYATPDFIAQIEAGLVAWNIEYFVHSSRRHTSEKPRLRFFILLSKPVTNDNYGPLSRIIATMFDPEMRMVDKVSFRKAQMMFMPTTSIDGEWFFYKNEGEPLDVDQTLLDFTAEHGDWRQFENWPRCEGESLRQTKEKAEDPRTKEGPVGDFCRAYDIFSAMERWIPGTYVPADDHSEKPRYTYTGGTTSSGAVVEDDGLFLYSHHGSDPCADMLVNAWDMVRLHLFHDLDEKVQPDDPPGSWPSWKAMLDLVKDDDRYRRAQAESRYDVNAMFGDEFEDATSSDFDPEDDADGLFANLVGEAQAESHEGSTGPRTGASAGTRKDGGTGRKRKGPPPKDWHLTLEMNRQGEFVASLANIVRIVQNDPRCRNAIEYNAFRQQPVTREPMKTRIPEVPEFEIVNRHDGDPWQDQHSHALRTMIEAPNGPGLPGWGIKVSDRDLAAAVELAARTAPFHPIIQRLEAQVWDRTPRAEELFIRYLGAPDDAYHREIARKWLLAAVTRLYEPGHKFDFVPILEGLQGKRKSTFISILALEWFGELKGDFADEKKMVEAMMGHWIMEIPELSGIARSEVEDVKAFVSQQKSSVRLSYGKRPTEFYRQCVFMGSTNQAEYLIDTTGNRRWWPVYCKVGMIDTIALERNVLQIWAEVVEMYREARRAQPTGTLPLFLENADAQRIALAQQEAARQQNDVDVIAGEIQEWLEQPAYHDRMDEAEGKNAFYRQRTCIAEVWRVALGNDRKPTRMDSQSVSHAMQALGWEKRGAERFEGFGVQKAFHRPPEDLI